MRHNYLTIAMTVLLLAGGHCAFAAKKSKTIKVETSKFEKNDTAAEAYVMVQWPVKGDKAIVDSLRKNINSWICGELNRPDDVKSFGESLFESLSIDWHSVYDDMEPEERLGAFTRHYEVTLETQTNL